MEDKEMVVEHILKNRDGLRDYFTKNEMWTHLAHLEALLEVEGEPTTIKEAESNNNDTNTRNNTIPRGDERTD